jgi:hypothetical protein
LERSNRRTQASRLRHEQNYLKLLLDSPLFRNNIINVFIGCKAPLIRQALSKVFVKLSRLGESIHFKHLVLKNTRLPIWINSTKLKYVESSRIELSLFIFFSKGRLGVVKKNVKKTKFY